MTQPSSTEQRINALESRILKLEKALQVTDGKITLQNGMSRIAMTNRDIVMEATGQIQIKTAGDIVLKGSHIREN